MELKALSLLQGAGDLHVHTSPSLVPGRKSDIWELIEACDNHKMAYVIVKWHHGDSFSSAHVVNRAHKGQCRLYGGLVLNETVGGINPYAVDSAVTLDAKVVWLPTLDAEGHLKAIGQLGGFPFQKVRRTKLPTSGLRICDEKGELNPSTKEVLSILHGTDTVLGTGHISKEEIFHLVSYLQKEHLKIHLLINHLDFDVPGLTIPEISQLSSSKIWFELAYFTLSAHGHSTAEQIKKIVLSNPSSQFVLASDSGQTKNPISPKAMLQFIELLLEAGLAEAEIRTMLHEHARNLLML